MFLHITHDDKFIDYFIANSEYATDIPSKFVIFTDDECGRLKHVKNANVTVIRIGNDSLQDLVGPLNKFSTVFVHYLASYTWQIIASLSPKTIVIWVFWGSDGFSHPALIRRFIMPKTLEYYTERVENNSIGLRIRRFIDSLFTGIPLKRLAITHELKWRSTMRRADFFAHYLENDYVILKNTFQLSAERLDFCYASWNQLSGLDAIKEFNGVSGEHLLIGNSADLSNNHFDMIDLVADQKINGGKKIILPLSYASPNKQYVDDVVEYGRKKLGDRLIPLTSFMPKEEYNAIIDSCGTVIMGHLRSQAFGNIQYALLRGKIIVMPEESVLYKFLKEKGFAIFSLEEFRKNGNTLTVSPNALNKNVKLLDQYFGKDATAIRYREMYQKIAEQAA